MAVVILSVNYLLFWINEARSVDQTKHVSVFFSVFIFSITDIQYWYIDRHAENRIDRNLLSKILSRKSLGKL